MSDSPKKPKQARKPKASKKGPEDFPTSFSASINHALNRIQLTENQAACVKAIEENKISFVQGPAGTAKTFVMCYAALKMLANNTIRSIVLSKPATAAKGEEIGFLPGTLEEKVSVMMESYRGNLLRILGDKLLEGLEGAQLITYVPLTYLRGVNFTKVFCGLDEAQNTDFRSLILFITRYGKGSRMMISGDVSQYDIKKDQVKLPKFVELFKSIDGVGTYEFTNADIVREKILIEITERYEKWKFDNNL